MAAQATSTCPSAAAADYTGSASAASATATVAAEARAAVVRAGALPDLASRTDVVRPVEKGPRSSFASIATVGGDER